MTRRFQGRESCLINADLAETHGGSFKIAQDFTRAAGAAGAGAVKYQYFVAEDLVGLDHPEHPVFKRFEMDGQQWRQLVSLAHHLGLLVYSDVFSKEGAFFMADTGCDGFKVHSSDIGNLPLLEVLGSLKKPVLLSAGAAMPRDISLAVEKLRDSGAEKMAIMLGFQGFPTALEDCKLWLIGWYAQNFGLPVGYADHVEGDSPMAKLIPLLALACGASVIEKHITQDRASHPENYKAAIEPYYFGEMVTDIRRAEQALGEVDFSLSEAEVAYNRSMKKYSVARSDIPAGTVIREEMIAYKPIITPEDIFPADIRDIIGRCVTNVIVAGQPIRYSSIDFRFAILISVRFASTRLPGKALVTIQGKPALAHLIERLQQVRLVQEIVVCTTTNKEDDAVAALAQAMGVQVFRGSETDVMARFIGAAEMVGADIIVRVTGDDILSDPEYIDHAIQHHLASNAEYTSVVGLPYGVDREIISVRALKWAHVHAEDTTTSEYITWYLDSPAFFRTTALKAAPEVWRPHYRLTLDTLEDLELLNIIFRELYQEGSIIRLEDVIRFLDSRPDLVEVNASVKPKFSRYHINTRMRLV